MSGPRSNPLQGFEPFADVFVIPGETGAFEARGADPRMIWRLSVEELARLSGHTAVRVQVEMSATEGRLCEPCVYFDWGDGFSEDTRKPLSLVRPGVYAAIGHSNAASCRQIRLDPSSGPCCFILAEAAIEGMGAPVGVAQLSASRRLVRRALRRLPTRWQALLRGAKATLFDQGARDAATTRLLGMLGGRAGSPWRAEYAERLQIAQNMRSPLFAAPPLEPPRRDPQDAKVLAFYLPQFHPIPENDRWWGKGFTEWTNVSKAVPQFVGHTQPRLPADLGHYDLRVPEVQALQAELAERTGVDAFCFHYYWFAGKRVLEDPLDSFANDPELTTPFALCWANENWTRRWDGLESEVLLAQAHSPEDDLAVFADLARYIQNPRYFRVTGRPLLIVYRPDLLPDPKATVKRWRASARAAGIGELFLLCTDAFGFAEYAQFGFDGLVEFPPHAVSIGEITHRIQRLNPAFTGKVYDYEAVVLAKSNDLAAVEDPRRFPGVMTAWDNEARKPGAGNVFHNATPDLFKTWVGAALEATKRIAPPSERLVFVNAWNEWAEGAYLEPDRWFGHGFAQALRSALQSRAPRLSTDHPAVTASRKPARDHDAVFLLHIYYPDLIEDFRQRLVEHAGAADVIISFPDIWTEEELARLEAAFPLARLEPQLNRGRDVEPFLKTLKIATDLNYNVFCKLHSKRSPHLPDGDDARASLMDELAGPDGVRSAMQMFASDPRLGLLGSAASEARLGDPATLHNNKAQLDHLAGRLGFDYSPATPFAAGTMFWGRVAAFSVLAGPLVQEAPFEEEMGRIDGTLAHAYERAMGAIALSAGYSCEFSL